MSGSTRQALRRARHAGQRDKAATFHQSMRQYVFVGDMVGGTEAETLEKRARAGQPLQSK